MLIHLAIRDFVLIERLDLTFRAGLCALTGETGAGKSIMLDALGMALGERAERSMVRQGASRCIVSATFEPPQGPALAALLEEHGLDLGDEFVLRRSLQSDGRSRAFINDQPVSVTLLRRVADLMVEVHGQSDRLRLLDATRQRELLDAYGGHEGLLATLQDHHGTFVRAQAGQHELEDSLARSAADRAYLEHVAGELESLAAGPGEEAALIDARARLMSREKLAAAIDAALDRLAGGDGVDGRISSAERSLERVAGEAGDLLEPAAAALERSRLEAEEALSLLHRARDELGRAGELEQVEERLFALRAAARKHRVDVDTLPALLEGMRQRLEALERGSEGLREARERTEAARARFVETAARLSEARRKAAGRLEKEVNAELPALRLEQARLEVRLEPLGQDHWGAAGAERVSFQVTTNPGAPAGPLDRVASGGELSRLTLALKVILARRGSRPCLIFDEVDTGIGGATADAVGERLARLGHGLQVLVVTHAPQVAARASHHVRISKQAGRRRIAIDVVELGEEARREEIARMLAGATVTEAARAAATSLLERPPA